jgi:hypothetical protein
MPSSNTNLRISEVDFDSIKANLKTFLKNQSEFSDYDFEGSAMNILLDVLAYNTHYMSYYLNMTANEMFLDTAQLRNSVLSHAKLLGYTPRSRTGATAEINVQVTPPAGDTTATLTLPRYTKFFSESIDSINYNFVTLDSYTTTKTVANTFSFSNVEIKEGETVSYQFLQDQNNPRQRFNIPSDSIDTSTLTVVVQTSVSNTSQDTFTLAEDLTELNSDSKIYFLDETESGTYTLYFGDNTFGKSLSNDNLIFLTYVETNGSGANKANVFTLANPVGGFSNTQVFTVSKASAGSDKESIEEIKFRAPIFYTTQNRAVTKNDYSVLLKRDYPNIESISIWGGEEYDPPQYGKAFISIKPTEGYSLTAAQKDSIINDVIKNRSILTVTPEIIDPDYLYLRLAIDVYYDPSKTTRTADEIKTIVRSAVLNYRDTNLNTFNSVFRNSKLQYAIDQCEKSITSNDVDVFMIKQIQLKNGIQQNYEIDFFSPLNRGSLQERLISRPTVSVYDSSNILRDVYFEEVQGSFTGVDSVSMITPGSGYSDSPVVTITGDGTGATASATVVNGQITSIDITNRGVNYTVATISITDTSGTGATAKANLLGRNGTIQSYYLKEGGDKVIIGSNAGTIDYDTGLVVLVALTGFSVGATPYFGLDQNVFTIQVKPAEPTLFPIRNRIITVDENDLSSIEINVYADDTSSRR